ncbi:MAG: non-ribosomal peptide synthetase, partial [Pseudomonadota bacterium]
NLDGETAHVVPLDNGCEQMPLTLQVRDLQATGDVRLAFMHNLAFLDRDEVRILQARLVHILTAMLETPDLPIGDLDIRPPKERDLLTRHGTGADAPTAGGRTLYDLIAQQAEETPDAIALVQGAERWRYAELLSRAERIAAALAKAGVQPGHPVLHAAHRTPVAIAGILGIWRAGGVYVPAEPDYPDARLAFMAADCDACAVLTDSDRAPRLKATLDLPTVALDEIEAKPSSSARPIGPDPEGPAYVIYTSGSTGTPKGVQVSHSAIAGHILGMCDLYEMSPKDVVLAFSSLSFDASLETMMGAFVCGAGVVVRDDTLWTPEELHDKVQAEGISVANLPPAYLAQWVAAWPDLPPLAGSALRLLISGGDILDNTVVPAAEATGVRLLNAYGPTEAVITTTIFEATGPSKGHESTAGARRTLPIGRPTPGRQLHILDRHGRPQPHGAEGELHIGGPFLADGYLGRPELSAERFVPDPFSVTAGARLYRTGDLCRWLPDWNLEFLGRLDDQVQVNGFRVELGEVEAAARDLPEVSDCAATPARDSSGAYLVLHVVTRHGQEEASDQVLRTALANRLPGHMVPASFVQHAELPRLSSGKIDRMALAEHQPEPGEATDTDAAPSTPEEERLCTIWAEILERPARSVHESFFGLGGHSLLAMQLVSQVRTAFGIELSMREVFEAPTITEMAALLQEKTASTTKWVIETDTPDSREFAETSREQHLI